jgi:hypothetical protein
LRGQVGTRVGKGNDSNEGRGSTSQAGSEAGSGEQVSEGGAGHSVKR